MPLAQALVSNSSLALLDLTGNQLGSAGIKLLVEAIKDHKALKTLIVDQNGICSEGAFALAQLVASPSCQVQELHTADNLISSVGLN